MPPHRTAVPARRQDAVEPEHQLQIIGDLRCFGCWVHLLLVTARESTVGTASATWP
jgi:hypothetical protein